MQHRILITGGAGFIGSNLARKLMGDGHAVFAVDNLSLGTASNLPDEVPLFVGDIAEPAVWSQLPPATAVVHLAGASSAPMFAGNLADCFHNNIVGFIRVLEWARAQGAARVLYASTSSVYGNVDPPLREEAELDLPNFYAVSKHSMEEIARMYHQQYGLEVIGFRFMSVYGPREDHKRNYANLVSQFIWEAEAGRRPTVYGDGGQTRDFTSVHDIAQALTRALTHPEPLGAGIFNVGTGEGTPVNLLVELLAELMGLPVEAEHIPNPVRSGYVRQQIADISRARAVLGYEPSVSLREGIEEILRIRNGA